MRKENIKIKKEFLETSQIRLNSFGDKRLKIGPEFLRIGISKSCNFNCLTCWNYSPLLKKMIPEKEKTLKIDKDLVFNLIDDLAEMRCLRVLFSGFGEPFTHPYIMNFIKKTREKGMLVYLQTNLSLVEKPYQLAKYLGTAANLVGVHLSAATAETYIKMHPNQKSSQFNKILSKIKILRGKGVPIRLVYVVNKINYQEIPKIFQMNEKLKTKLHLELMDYEAKNGIEKIALSQTDKIKLIRILEKFKSRKRYLIDTNIIDFINQLNYSSLGIKNLKSCYVGYFFSTVNEEGNVNYCFSRHKKFSIGNLNNESFKNIWFSKKYNNLRIRLARGNFPKACQNCLRKRGYNFKLRIFINPEIRDFNLDAQRLESPLSYHL